MGCRKEADDKHSLCLRADNAMIRRAAPRRHARLMRKAAPRPSGHLASAI